MKENKGKLGHNIALPDLSDINDQFQDFQDDLMIREKKLKIPTTWDKEDIEKMLCLLQETEDIDLLKK